LSADNDESLELFQLGVGSRTLSGMLRRCLVVMLFGSIACACGEAAYDRTPPDLDATALEASEDAPPVPEVEVSRVAVSFVPTADEVPNPDRGFYAFVDDISELTAEGLSYEYEQGVRLVYTPIRLDDYRDAVLSSAKLGEIDRGLGLIRDAGLGLILRFVYAYPEDEADYAGAKDASLGRVVEHIGQLAPILRAHADIITFWQAGFIGAWGEWHSSSNGLDSAAGKRAVRDALLAVLPDDTFLQFRYPPDLASWIGSAMPDEAGFAATSFARMGFHNDCFMSSDDDVGTFEAGLADPLRDFAAELARVTPMGGETCDAEDGSVQRRGCEHILAEGARYHLTYLGRDYHTAFHDRWRAEGCFDEVRRKMGYRLELRSVSHERRVRPGGTLTMAIELENSGWARAFAKRVMVVSLIGEMTIALPTSIDARTWVPGRHVFEVALTVPAEAPAGTYEVALALPQPGLADGRRAIRFAVADDVARGQAWSSARLTTGTQVIVE